MTNAYEERDKLLAAMGFPTYVDYLKSGLWEWIKLQLSTMGYNACYCCESQTNLVWHHTRYDLPTLIGNMSFPDIALVQKHHLRKELLLPPFIRVCWECHNLAHYYNRVFVHDLDEVNARIRDRHLTSEPECIKQNCNAFQSCPPNGDATKTTAADTDFDTFWAIVPNKVGKEKARKSFDKAAKLISKNDGVNQSVARHTIIEAMEAFSKSDIANGEYCPHPSTWLSRGQYSDDRTTWGNNHNESNQQILPPPENPT